MWISIITICLTLSTNQVCTNENTLLQMKSNVPFQTEDSCFKSGQLLGEFIRSQLGKPEEGYVYFLGNTCNKE